jgi:uncharacterized protein (DUF1778 family)
MQTNASVTVDKSRTARLEARLSVEQKAVLQQAATLSGRTLSEFVIASAQEAATRVIQEHETIRLSRAEQIAFVTALLDPPAPNERLRQAAAAYRRAITAIAYADVLSCRQRKTVGVGFHKKLAIDF